MLSLLLSEGVAHAAFLDRPTTLVDRGISFVGIFVLVGLCWAVSERRDKVDWKLVGWGIVLQLVVGAFVLVPGLSQVLVWLSTGVKQLLDYAGEGATFVFQSVSPHTVNVGPPPGTPTFFVGTGTGISPPVKTFAFWVLPTIVFFSAFSNVLYHFGILQVVVRGIGWVMQRTLGTSGAETLATAGNIFLGQTEAPLLVRPFLDKMTRSEMMAVMVAGFATIAVGVLGLYADVLHSIPNAGGHLLVASVMSAPATFVCAKLVIPETEVAETGGRANLALPKGEGTLLSAIAGGAIDGMRLAINVAALLIAIVALVALVDGVIGLVPLTFCAGTPTTGYTCAAGITPDSLDLSRILGWIGYPFALIMGVRWDEAATVGALLGKKIVLTELVAYFDLGATIDAPVATLSQRSAIIAAYAICGFANIASVGIQIGGIGAIAEKQKERLAEIGFKAMLVGSVATCMTGAVVGVFV